jgi:hypothetical protein
MLHALLTGAANTSFVDSYKDDIADAPRPYNIPQQRMYAIVRALDGEV